MADGGETEEVARESVTEPAKVMRIGAMVKQLLDEVHEAPLDEASRERLAEIYERSVTELSMALSPDLQEELHMLTSAVRRRRACRPRRNSGSRRPSSSGGSKGCSTASRPL